jgi:hypothetical protein
MTDERRAAIIRLLETRDDHLPQPVRRTHTTAGFVHRVKVRESCSDCLANGRSTRPTPGCESCGGRGFVEVWRNRDPYAIDKVEPYGLNADQREARIRRDQEIERLDDAVKHWRPATPEDELAAANERGEPWEEARKQMYRSFDYQALDLALETLRHHNESLSRALHAVYVYRLVEPSTTLEAACGRAVAFIDRLMPDPIRAPQASLPASTVVPAVQARPSPRDDRNEKILELALSGARPEEIAVMCRCSLATVYRAVKAA